ncbi:hypothetical protein [Salinimonas iocasae]|uniref:Uncharacterized protein n=1 Tax=Salinimonas iocasae TaxID=2572577 RepID=A0A5B7YER7_9ALTE|nr:hypothetical protein [Salinimonas iocasae]QCZ93743.1 hypothetical protein FBQ74_09670 [Salinimonas iocasae]
MMFVSSVSFFNVQTINQSQDYTASLFRSAIEETAKIVVCYVVFETLSSCRFKYATLAFCSLVALFESASTAAYFTYMLSNSYISLMHYVEVMPSAINSLTEIENEVSLLEAMLLFSFEIIRIYVHFLLTYTGVQFLRASEKRRLFLISILIHGLANLALLFISGTLEGNTEVALARNGIAVATICVMIFMINHNKRAPDTRLKVHSTLRI